MTSKFGWLAIAAVLWPWTAVAAPSDPGAIRVLNQDVQLACLQPVPTRLTCDFRLGNPADVAAVSATLGGVELGVPVLSANSAAPETAAVLFLVDTSDPRRQDAVDRIARHITALVDAGEAHHRFGLATFDSDIRMVAPLGSAPADITDAAAGMRAAGPTTELFRSTLEAVRMAGDYPATRRAVFVFSDGLAEDQAYYHADVVRAAEERGVVVYGLGYPRTVAQSVALQTLRRLADETAGRFVAVDEGNELPSAFLAAPFQTLDNGGRFELDLDPAVDAGFSGSATSRVVLTTESGTVSALVPVALPAARAAPPPVQAPESRAPATADTSPADPVPVDAEADPPAQPTAAEVVPVPQRVAEEPEPAPVAPPAPPPSPAARLDAPDAKGDTGTMWYIVLGLLVLGAMAALWHFRDRLPKIRVVRGAHPGPAADDDGYGLEPSDQPDRSLAILELQDGSRTRFAVSNSPCRVGRHSDNDVSLNDPSVSRHHAEIVRRANGTYTVMDLDSMNGVYVNDREVQTAVLAEGDLVEFGDVQLRFSMRPEGLLPGEETVMLSTVASDGSLVPPKRTGMR